MKKRIIYFVCNPSPMLGCSLMLSSGYFSWRKECNYINALQHTLNKKNPNWTVKRDDTESDIELIEKAADLIVCVPGLKYRFYTGGFNKSKIIHLTVMQYASQDSAIIISKIKQLFPSD
ncbi:hypothetical protein PMPD1_2109 [Paramixta manurensis]|uniref:Nitrogen fixation protein NifS n=1 Tax=Paramixta manurensis TaxID=2740817 RepID=A0A6M8U8R5_9GAMM|nr:hypothetical protein PMPD1_2109 [Erwiniaceae bacterium PD-1]